MATAPGPIIRLFVSSTFADFSIERTILQREVFPALRDLCRREGFRFQPIDLRWGVSQEAGKGGRTLAICFDELRRCQTLSPDFNLLILLGDRYGWRPLPESISSSDYERLAPHLAPPLRALLEQAYALDRNARPAEYVLRARDGEREAWETEVAEPLRSALAEAAGRADFTAEEALPYVASATHQEIERGLLAAGGDPAAVVCALRSFGAAPTGPNAKSYAEADGEARKRLAALRGAIRGRLGDGRILDYAAGWRGDEPELDREVLRGQLQALLERRVREVIAQRRQAGTRDAVAEANARFAEERTAHFVGRADALERLAHEMAQPSGHPLVVTGPSGAGKSTLLAEAVRRATVAQPAAVMVTRYVGITPGTTTLRELLVGLRQEIAAGYGQEAPTIPADDAQLIAEFPAALAAATAERPLLLVVDALDQLGAAPQRVDWLPSELPTHVAVVVSVLPDRPELATLRGRLGAERVYALGALSTLEGAALLNGWLGDAGRMLRAEQRLALLVGFLAEGRPLYLRLAFERARRWRSFDAAPALPSTIPGLLRDLFAELARDDQHGPLLVAHALGDLGAAKNGLAEDEVLDVLAKDEAVRADLRRLSPESPPVDPDLPLPVVLWARLYADLEPYLAEREADGASLITFYHRQLREAVDEHYLHGGDGLARHQALAAYFGAQPLRLGERVNRRQLSEQPYQQAAGEQWEALHTTLTNVSFLEAKIADQGVSAVVADLALAPEREDIQRISAAIRAGAVVLEQKPDELENQIQGRVGVVSSLHDMPVRLPPFFRLRTSSLLPADPALVRTFIGHIDAVRGCAFSPDGRLALSASYDGTLRLWVVESGREVGRLEGHPNGVEGCAFSPDGHLALSASTDCTLKLWDVENGREVYCLTGHVAAVNGCAFSPDGRLALSASTDQTLRLWDLASGQTMRTFTGHTGRVNDCAFSPDGHLALSASHDETLRLWNIASGECLRTFAGHTGLVYGCAFSPDGHLALSASWDGTLRLWEVESGEQQRCMEGHADQVNACAFSPNGRLAISASDDRTLRLWEVESGREIYCLEGHTSSVEGCALSLDGRLALSASLDQTLRLWQVAILPEQRQRGGHTEAVNGCTFSPDGRLALSASDDSTVRLWEVAGGHEVRSFEGHTDLVLSCAFSPDGQFALSSSFDHTLRLWDVASGHEIRCFQGHTDAARYCVFSPDGHWILSASDDCTVRLWDISSGHEVHRFQGHSAEVNGCAFSPDGRFALSASRDETMRLWEVASGRELYAFKEHTSDLNACAFSPDGRIALSASRELVRLWDVAARQTLRFFRGHTGSVQQCAFSSDGRLVLSASVDKTLRLWNVASGREVARWLTDSALGCCAYRPDGLQVLAGDALGSVHFLALLGSEDANFELPAGVPVSARATAVLDAPVVVSASRRVSQLASPKKRGLFWWLRRR